MKRIFYLYILLLLFLSAGVLALADEPSSSLDDKPSVDTAANTANTGGAAPTSPTDATTAAAVSGDTHASYLYDLKKLIEKSRENIKEVNEKIKEQAVIGRVSWQPDSVTRRTGCRKLPLYTAPK